MHREVVGEVHADGDGLPVAHRVAGRGFEGVAEGVTVVELLPLAGIELVDLDDALLDGQALPDVGDQARAVLQQLAVVGRQVREQRAVGVDVKMEYLAESRADVVHAEGVQEPGVDVDGRGRVERPDEVLLLPHVDRRLAADGGIGHGEQRRREVDPLDAPVEDRGSEAGHVLADAAAEGHDGVVTPRLAGDQLGDQGLRRVHRLAQLRCLHQQELALRHDGREHVSVERVDVRVADDEGALADVAGERDGEVVHELHGVVPESRTDPQRVRHGRTHRPPPAPAR